MKKKCSKCKIEKKLSEFGNLSSSKDGKKYQCKKCISDDSKVYCENNKDKRREYRESYKERKNELRRIKYHKELKNDPEYIKKVKEQKKRYYKTEKAKELKRKTDKRYREKNRDSILERRREKEKDPYLILTERVRGRFRKIVRRNIIECRESKTKKSKELLGCSIEFYKEYLEEQFIDGMSWDNYGEWHIDHIRPICLFDLNNEEELFEAFNYKNTQPLLAKDNLSKGAKYENEVDNKKTS